MNWDAIGAIGDLVSGIGVIVTLLYLAFQIKLDREATQANTIQAFSTELRESTLAMATSDRLGSAMEAFGEAVGVPQLGVRVLIDSLGMSFRDAQAMNALLQLHFRQAVAFSRLPDTGVEMGFIRLNIVRMLRLPPVSQWWEIEKQNGYPSSFVAEVERWRQSEAGG